MNNESNQPHPEDASAANERESRLTARLFGELPEAEDRALEDALASDPELSRLNARLRATLGYVRAAVEEPAAPSAGGAPLPVMSAGRREALLARLREGTARTVGNPPDTSARIGQDEQAGDSTVIAASFETSARSGSSLTRGPWLMMAACLLALLFAAAVVWDGTEPAESRIELARGNRDDVFAYHLGRPSIPTSGSGAGAVDASPAKAVQGRLAHAQSAARAADTGMEAVRFALSDGAVVVSGSAPAAPVPPTAVFGDQLDRASSEAKEAARETEVRFTPPTEFPLADAGESRFGTMPRRSAGGVAGAGGMGGVVGLGGGGIEGAAAPTMRSRFSLRTPPGGPSPSFPISSSLAPTELASRLADPAPSQTLLAASKPADRPELRNLERGLNEVFAKELAPRPGVANSTNAPMAGPSSVHLNGRGEPIRRYFFAENLDGAVAASSDPRHWFATPASDLNRNESVASGSRGANPQEDLLALERFGDPQGHAPTAQVPALSQVASVKEFAKEGSVLELKATDKEISEQEELGIVAKSVAVSEPENQARKNKVSGALRGNPRGEVLAFDVTEVPVRSLAEGKPDELLFRQSVMLRGRDSNAADEKAVAGENLTELTLDAATVPAEPADLPLVPSPEVAASENNFSTFSLQVTDVSYKLAEASLNNGQVPSPSSVRAEEFVNAFQYRDPEPAPGLPVGFVWERAQYPFGPRRDVMRFSVRTVAQGRESARPLNLVLLLDASGSMERSDRVATVREALRVLGAQLQPADRISVVTFARTARLWIDGLPGGQASELASRVGELRPEGGTHLEGALGAGYETALKHFIPNGNNRVVLLTDGAANLGELRAGALRQVVEDHRKRGIALDCFGIGFDGYQDELLEALSRNGDGRYGFVNSPEDASKGFADQLAGALQVAASDVKVQVEFNPRRVNAWRQIGYARHQLAQQQFRDNTVDAAELSAAEAGNALYVIEPLQRGEGPVATVRVRFRKPSTEAYAEHEWVVPYVGPSTSLERSSPAMRLAVVAATFAETLARSPYVAGVTHEQLLGYLSGVPEQFLPDPRPQQLEQMLRQSQSIQGIR